MGRPGKIHAVVAALLVGVVALAFALGVHGYADSQRTYQTSQFEALAGALQLAHAIPDAPDPVIVAAVEREAGSLARGGRVDRVFFVRKGKQIPSLNISKPATVVADLGRLGGTKEEQEALVTLSAQLEKHFANGGAGAALDHRTLTWTVGARNRRVAAWPVVTAKGYQGIAGVEVLATPRAQSPARSGALLLAALVALFALGLWFLGDKVDARAVFVGGAVLALLVTGYGTYHDQRERTASFVETRDQVTSRFVNRVAFTSPDGLRELDSLWTRIYKAPADGLTVAALDSHGASGAVLCQEDAGVVSSLAWDRTFPVLIAVGVVLFLGAFLLPGLAALIHGLVTLPGVYAYVAPAMLGMTVLVLVPFVMGVGLGFFNMDYEFVGLENFSDILFPTATSQTNFYYTLGFTILWTVSNVVLHVSLGLFMALVLNNKKVRFRGIFRVLLIIPWAIPNYVTALIWKWMFTSQIGAINLMMEAVGLTPINWFGPTFWTNFFAVLATNTWLGFPFMMVVSLGALQSIPNELYEAADIDGASRWQKFRNVTLPLLKPALFPAIILGTIWTFNMFNIIYLVTRGQPDNKTNILITEAYRFFAELNQYGVAAAYCVLIFFILLGYTLVTNRITRATEGAFE
jgi:ABC-type sugar transport system permease subunit